jgi:nicotinate-nucleotide adenylyltransferase
MNNVLIYGGSFDPIHNGHLTLLRAGIKHLKDDLEDLKVIVTPAYMANFKNGHVAPYHGRLEMVDNAIRNDWFLQHENIEIDDYEGGVGRRVYTSDYLDYLGVTPEYPAWILAGADLIPRLDTWHRAEDLCRRGRFLIGLSRGSSIELPVFTNPFYIEFLPSLISGEVLDGKRLSSTSIRKIMATGGDVSKYVPASALDYIKTRGLYKVPTPEVA